MVSILNVFYLDIYYCQEDPDEESENGKLIKDKTQLLYSLLSDVLII